MKELNRKQKLLLNSTSSLSYQLVKLLCGFILPRMFLTSYGSAVNGLVASITHFLGFITLAECGVGAVVKSALYKPLADKDEREISKIIISSERFFRKVAYLLIIYTIGLLLVYPWIVKDSFGYLYTAALILAISINSFAEYYIGISYQLLLGADQLGFIRYFVNVIALVVNTIACIILMKSGASIQMVKLSTSLIYMIQPVALALLAKKRYSIDRKIVLTEEPIKQKWNGFAQHVAAVVLSNTDTVILTLLSTLENVSVYSVYFLVVNGVKGLMVSMTNGIQALFGNMYAKGETEKLNKTFASLEWMMHTGVTFIFGLTAMLIVPFVSVYTKGINDANYIVPLFGFLITMAEASHCWRLPYVSMVYAAGHFKQTQYAAIVEVVINIAISVALVARFGLIGVAIGTFTAVFYRNCYFVVYLSKNILNREVKFFVKHMLVDALCIGIMAGVMKVFSTFFSLGETGYIAWVILGVKAGIAYGMIVLVINLLFYKSRIIEVLSMIRKK